MSNKTIQNNLMKAEIDTDIFFLEQYTVVNKENEELLILVPVRHGEHEKDNHDLAGWICNILYPDFVIDQIIYC